MLPITLPVGTVLIYGFGTITDSLTGAVPDNDIWRFGDISQTYDGGEVFVYGNPQVMFKESDVRVRLFYLGYPYTMIDQAKLAGIIEPLP